MIYFERLTILAFIKYLSYVQRNILFKKNKIELFYFDISKIGVFFVKIVGYLVPISFKKMNFKYTDIRDREGTYTGCRIMHEDLSVVLQEIIKSEDYSNILPVGLNDESVLSFIKKNIGTTHGHDRFETKALRDTLLLIQVVALHMSNECQDGHSIFFIEKRCWIPALSAYSGPLGISIVPTSRIIDLRQTMFFIRARLSEKPRVYEIVDSIKKHRIPSLNDKAKPLKYFDTMHSKVLVDSKLSKYNASSFWNQSALLPENVLFVSENYPINQNQWNDVKSAGMDAVALKPSIAQSSEVSLFLPRIDKKEVCHKYTSRFYHPRERKFVKFQLDRYYYLKSYWLDLFRACKARVYVSHFKYLDKHIAATGAINELGGIAAIWQESYSEFSTPSALVNADLVFGFSPAVADVEKRNSSKIQYFVAIGYIGDYRFDLARTKHQEIRSLLKENGARKIVAFLDETDMEDDRWGPGHLSTQEEYQFILEKVLSEPWLGLVLKPKRQGTLRKRLGPVAGILEQAIDTGRCYISNQDHIITPAMAAMASDIAIHGSLYACTAGMEAALVGAPTLMLDSFGWDKSRIYKLGEKRVAFREWQPLWEALMEHWNKQPIPGLGDWSPIIDELDPFRDGKAASRMGTYLHWLIQGYENGQDREVILADAAEKYCKRWGNDKVVKMS